MIMELENSKVILRPIDETDTENIVTWRNKDSVKRHFIYRKPFTIEGHTAWLQNMVKTGKVAQFIIYSQELGKDVGSVFLRDIDQDNRKAEYGIFLGEDDARGHGIGTAAAKLIVKYGFDELRLHKIFLRVFADNIRAIKSYEKAGFRQEAYLKDEVYISGAFQDIVLMAQFEMGSMIK